VRRRVLLAALAVIASMPARPQPAGDIGCVGVLLPGSRRDRDEPMVVFREALRQRGYTDGGNVRLLVQSAEGDAARIPDLAREVAAAGCRVVVTAGTAAARAVREVLPATPIVLAGSADPVTMGFAKSLARPGGTITGISVLGPEFLGKQIELLAEIHPGIRRIVALLNAANPGNAQFRAALLEHGRALGITVHVREVDGSDALPAALAWASEIGAEGLLVITDPMFVVHRHTIFETATALRLPSVGSNLLYARAGALVSYAPNPTAIMQGAARYVADILGGTDPGELPIAHPTAFEMLVNERTARQLGLKLPAALLARADEVIE
jgi:putative tryptophan/tyrosine transport system substrate-binding protein